MLDKNYIKFNFFDYAAFVLIMKKFEEKFKMCIDSRVLNVFTIKNKNSSSFIRKIFVHLCVVKYYIKLNVIVVFNKIRIIENDEKKTIFFIKYELYEYVIMFFEFCNAFEIFQFYINETLRKYLNDFCNVYLNDVFIYNNNKKKHTIHVRKMLVKFKIIDFYLNIDKCEFFVIEVKYFDFVIIIENVKMNFDKIKTIFE